MLVVTLYWKCIVNELKTDLVANVLAIVFIPVGFFRRPVLHILRRSVGLFRRPVLHILRRFMKLKIKDVRHKAKQIVALIVVG